MYCDQAEERLAYKMQDAEVKSDMKLIQTAELLTSHWEKRCTEKLQQQQAELEERHSAEVGHLEAALSSQRQELTVRLRDLADEYEQECSVLRQQAESSMHALRQQHADALAATALQHEQTLSTAAEAADNRLQAALAQARPIVQYPLLPVLHHGKFRMLELHRC